MSLRTAAGRTTSLALGSGLVLAMVATWRPRGHGSGQPGNGER